MTKKLLGLLFVTLLFTTVAMATQVGEFCGANVMLGPGEPTVPAGFTATCAAFTVPLGDTLTGVDILVDDEFTSAAGASTVTFSFTVTGGTFTPISWSAVASNTGGGISGPGTPGAGCSLTTLNPPTNAYDCAASPFTAISSPSGGPAKVYGANAIGISDAWAMGSAGLLEGGTTNLNVYEYFTYSVTPTTPEPASLVMVGGGLIGLAMLVRRKRRA